MGYYTRFTLAAFDPTSLEPVDPARWPSSYLSRINFELAPQYFRGDASVQWPSGSIGGGEAVRWYDWETDFRAFSASLPHYVWALRGEGEEPEDRWICYAYRGGSYKESQEPWVPPPPDMSRLPGVIR